MFDLTWNIQMFPSVYTYRTKAPPTVTAADGQRFPETPDPNPDLRIRPNNTTFFTLHHVKRCRPMRIRPGSDFNSHRPGRACPCGQFRANGPRLFDPRAELAPTRETGGPWFSERTGAKPLADSGGAPLPTTIPWDTLFLTFFPRLVSIRR